MAMLVRILDKSIVEDGMLGVRPTKAIGRWSACWARRRPRPRLRQRPRRRRGRAAHATRDDDYDFDGINIHILPARKLAAAVRGPRSCRTAQAALGERRPRWRRRGNAYAQLGAAASASASGGCSRRGQYRGWQCACRHGRSRSCDELSRDRHGK